ncbi:MAG: hypothetical protein RL684_1132 [Pseudomonadota bacterium]
MGTAPHGDSPGAAGLRVITLASACTPMPLNVPFRHELEGFTVFRSHSGVGADELYYLHVGYFANEARAREALQVIRKYFPFATIDVAPSEGMGSLDDTLNTDFQVLRSATAQVVGRRVARPASTRAQAQHYAVLLVRRISLLGAAPIPRLPAFRGYSVYAVRASSDSGDCQDVRLGFFPDVVQARQFADAIRSHFPMAAVLPVSDREQARVTGLGRQGDAAARQGAARTEASARLPSARNSPEIRASAQTFSQ